LIMRARTPTAPGSFFAIRTNHLDERLEGCRILYIEKRLTGRRDGEGRKEEMPGTDRYYRVRQLAEQTERGRSQPVRQARIIPVGNLKDTIR